MAEKWIQKAIKKPGALRAELGVKGDKPIPAKNHRLPIERKAEA